MKNLFTALVFTLCLPVYAQTLKCSYLYEYKERENQKNPKKDYALCIEVDRENFMCYSQNKFLRDSTSSEMFARGEDMYTVRDSTGKYPRGVDWNVFADLASGNFTIYDRWMLLTFEQHGEYELPEWEVGEESEEICGYFCRKARANYYGREWTVWYTEEIPIGFGPWLLWGTPGLILRAEDEKGLFRFVCEEICMVEDNRKERLEAIIEKDKKGNFVVVKGGLEEVEEVRLKARRDLSVTEDMMRVWSQTYDVDGTLLPKRTDIPYIPLIAEEYWK